jgi:hypothetical protein
MTPEERQHFNYLCQRIAIENDPQTFDSLVKELEALLGAKHERLRLKRDSASIPATAKPDPPTAES